MTYQESIQGEMSWLAREKKTVFVGEGLLNAGRIYSTLDGVSPKRCIEMPICENLIVGTAIGLSLEGYSPIVVFQRMDFMLIASDAIINHACLISEMSGKKVKLPMIIRAIIGSRKKEFDVGPQHRHDFRHIFKPYLPTWDYKPGIYKKALNWGEPILVVEDRDEYEKEV